MNRSIKKVAVLGSGVMGSRIAAHFANIGVQVLLLDIVPREMSEAEKKRGLEESDPEFRNRIVETAFKEAVGSKPAPLYDKEFADRVSLGNFSDDMSKIKDCDWVIEVVVENLKIKKQVFDDVEKHRRPGSIISSNTSGIPIHLMLDGRSEDFQKNFLGTHFFNPPRYLRLLEVIPTEKTDKDLVDFVMHYGDRYLGKTTVLCKDTPAFIANRVGIYSIMKVVETMQKMDLTVDEVDKLNGPVIGRPKSATFRTSDVVGLDTLIKVANGLHDTLENDESRDIFQLPDVVKKMENKKWLGDKTGQGFYKKTKNDKGETEILTLDLKDLEYKPKERVKFSSLESTKQVEDLKKRIPMLISAQDKAGEFYRDTFFGLFKYVSNRIPEIADELYKIDDALRAGFGWDLGPFELWDAVGVKKSVEKMKSAGYDPKEWVEKMLSNGNESFYKIVDGERKYYDINSGEYKSIPGTEGFIILDNLRKDKVLWSNSGASIFDLGDGVINLEFHTKMNSLGSEVIQGMHKAFDMAEKDYRGLVIGNQATNFSAGANLAMILMYAVEQEYDEIDMMIRQFQQTMMRVRYSSIPVVVAPHGLTLGGGCEMTMHADYVQAAAETYIGLVEVGVGLIPGGGGTKEMALRVSENIKKGDVVLNDLQDAYMNIAMAKVATSAHEAIPMKILKESDGITINKDRQIADAKAAVINIADKGYTQPIQKKDIMVQGRTAMALFAAGVTGMKMGRYISSHDQKIAEKLSYVICGGDLSYPQEVSEQYLLDLEREAFLSLTGEKKTLERIQAMLKTGKPLRN